MTMTDSHSDALVFFGAMGDLAYKKIFPSLQALVKRGHLAVPDIGVARAGAPSLMRQAPAAMWSGIICSGSSPTWPWSLRSERTASPFVTG
jgi:Glucose-6-phosphate dehydrogenase, NAD binding domain